MAKKIPFNPRKFMEQAVKVMNDSIPEHRDDGKAVPRVGAVLWKPDETVDLASRGELRDGDHAEYTLLERKNSHCKLDGCILFSTLEPCAPKARTFPKLGCAERIVLARIKEVWVGIEDPDPAVDRKGIKYLQDNGIQVQMFDRDLQEQIQKVNSQFIDQALERSLAVTEEEKPRAIRLSDLEDEIETVEMADLSNKALENYRHTARIKDKIGSSFYRRLEKQGLLKKREKTYLPTGFGLLLFGKEPRLTMPQAGLLGTIHYPNGEEEPKNFEGPMVLIPDGVEQWLKDKLPNIIDRSTMRRQQVPGLPFEMIREAVVNALVHRDYDIRQAKCQLVVTPETIIVKSPGCPLPPITLEKLQNFDTPMLSRNPELHYVFGSMELAEERGLGVQSLKRRAQESGLPLPRYTWDDPYLVLTLYRSPQAASTTLAPDILNILNEDERTGWEYLATQRQVTRKEYETHTGYDTRKAQRHLKRFVEMRLLQAIGSGRAKTYRVVSP